MITELILPLVKQNYIDKDPQDVLDELNDHILQYNNANIMLLEEISNETDYNTIFELIYQTNQISRSDEFVYSRTYNSKYDNLLLNRYTCRQKLIEYVKQFISDSQVSIFEAMTRDLLQLKQAKI